MSWLVVIDNQLKKVDDLSVPQFVIHSHLNYNLVPFYVELSDMLDNHSRPWTTAKITKVN